MGKLVLFLADGTTMDVPLDKERLTIGRRADNDVCLPYPAVSGEHAAVVTILADSFLEDLGSTNGTLVNGKAISKHFLVDHDQVDIGRQRLVYMSDNDAKVDPLPPDMLRHQMRGLGEKVAPARVVPPAGGNVRPILASRAISLEAEIEHGVLGQGAAPGGALPAARPSGTYAAPTARPPELPAVPVLPSSSMAAFGSKEAAATNRRASLPAAVTPVGRDPLARPDVPVRALDRAPDHSQDPAPERAPEPAAPQPSPRPAAPSVRVLSGPSSGRTLPLTKDELSIGRIGAQVAVVRRTPDGYRLVPLEGASPPKINGAAVAPGGSPLHPGDTFEIAGVRLELSVGALGAE